MDNEQSSAIEHEVDPQAATSDTATSGTATSETTNSETVMPEALDYSGIPSESLDSASQPFIGRWNQLVSTTNWEKGRIIVQWRKALEESDAPATEFSDEAWARRVGGVTGQHVGRLRRVYQRFGQTYETFAGLYWSHFHAALDWDDAEMWLEGAVQTKWSVSQMRQQRWQAMGALEGEKPKDDDIVSNELDEDFEPALNQDPVAQRLRGEMAEVQGPPIPEGPDFGDEDHPSADDHGASIYADDERENVEFVKPFENLSDLPDDLAEAFEMFKLAILRHKTSKWDEIPLDDVLASLDALKQLALAPSAD